MERAEIGIAPELAGKPADPSTLVEERPGHFVRRDETAR
jgi:hypothetical protein